MPIFIADHTGSLISNTDFVRPIHIGAELANGGCIGQEPDNLAPGNISHKQSYADLRAFHHIRRQYEGQCDYVAILQYRRMYVLGTPHQHDPRLLDIESDVAIRNRGVRKIDMQWRSAFLRYFETRDETLLRDELGDAQFIANGFRFPKRTVARQYLGTTKKTYPGQPEYLDAWHDMRRVLERKTSADVVAQGLDGHSGYFNNCFVARWADFQDYTDFLFDVLGDLNQYDDLFRVFGYLAERVFGVYVAAYAPKVQSRAMMFFENQSV